MSCEPTYRCLNLLTDLSCKDVTLTSSIGDPLTIAHKVVVIGKKYFKYECKAENYDCAL